jgi:hypothetical protein
MKISNEYKIRKWLILKFHGSGHLPNHTTSKLNNRMFENDHFQNCMPKMYFIYKVAGKKIQKGYIKFNYVVCLSDTCSSCHVTIMGSLIVFKTRPIYGMETNMKSGNGWF